MYNCKTGFDVLILYILCSEKQVFVGKFCEYDSSVERHPDEPRQGVGL